MGQYEILAKYIKLAYIYLVCNVKDEAQKINKFIYSLYHEEEKKTLILVHICYVLRKGKKRRGWMQTSKNLILPPFSVPSFLLLF